MTSRAMWWRGSYATATRQTSATPSSIRLGQVVFDTHFLLSRNNVFANIISLRLLSDNGASYVSGELADWLKEEDMNHVRGAPYHPQTQSKIERWHQTLKNRILLENYFLTGDLNASIERFVEHYNHHRYHECLRNLTPADVYFGRGETILLERERIKQNTFKQRRLQYRNQAA